MFARCCIQAIVREHQALDWLAADDVRFDDLVDVGLGDVSIPDGVGIDHEIWAMLALIEAAGLVGSHFAFEAAFGQLLLEEFLQVRVTGGVAASPRMSRRALVAAHENVFFELGHGITEQNSTNASCDGALFQRL